MMAHGYSIADQVIKKAPAVTEEAKLEPGGVSREFAGEEGLKEAADEDPGLDGGGTCHRFCRKGRSTHSVAGSTSPVQHADFLLIALQHVVVGEEEEESAKLRAHAGVGSLGASFVLAEGPGGDQAILVLLRGEAVVGVALVLQSVGPPRVVEAQ